MIQIDATRYFLDEQEVRDINDHFNALDVQDIDVTFEEYVRLKYNAFFNHSVGVCGAFEFENESDAITFRLRF